MLNPRACADEETQDLHQTETGDEEELGAPAAKRTRQRKPARPRSASPNEQSSRCVAATLHMVVTMPVTCR